MATVFMDNFEIYGTATTMLDGMYAEVLGSPSLTVEEGKSCLFIASSLNAITGVRKVINNIIADSAAQFCNAFRIKTRQLPSSESNAPCFITRDGSNSPIFSVSIDTTGRLVVWTGTPSSLVEIVRTASPVIKAGTWQFIEMKWHWAYHSPNLSLQIYVDEAPDPVIDLDDITLVGYSPELPVQVVLGCWNQASIGAQDTWYADFHVWSTWDDELPNDLLGDVAVATLWPNQDIETGWTPNYRSKINAGVLDLVSNGTLQLGRGAGISCADSNDFEFGSGDFTIESFVRFDSVPDGATAATIISKWRENKSDQRTFELRKCGPSLNGGNIEFRVSTDGTAAGVHTVISQPWEPETDTWYHIAVVRASGETMLFIDGIMQGVPQTDTYSYFNGTSRFNISGQNYDNSSITPYTSVLGWYDETRISKGVARYTENFIPTAVAFPRGGSDPDWSNVVLLCGYDVSISDESSFNRTIRSDTASFGQLFASISIPEDGEYQFQTINAEDTLAFKKPRDDTSISASLYSAEAILTLDSLPSNGDTVTIGNDDVETYKFVTALSAAYDVLIGATIEATLHNLVAAINEDTGQGTIYGTGTIAHEEVYGVELPSPQCKVVAMLPGAAGNSISVSNSGDGSWGDSTLTGGADIPGPSSFRFTRMPPGVTRIVSAMAVTRAYKTESGPAKMKTNFVGPSGTVTEGTENALPVNPSYNTDIFNKDPDTGQPITPATLVQGRVQFDRTE